MAVKVMLAPAVSRPTPAPALKPAPAPEPRPRRRRASVFDGEGREVFITLMCLKCHKMKPLSQFGLRRMADGAIRNQPWCRPCRNDASAETARRKRQDPAGAGPLALAQELPAAEPTREEVRPVDPGTLAAQVTAALRGGRG